MVNAPLPIFVSPAHVVARNRSVNRRSDRNNALGLFRGRGVQRKVFRVEQMFDAAAPRSRPPPSRRLGANARSVSGATMPADAGAHRPAARARAGPRHDRPQQARAATPDRRRQRTPHGARGRRIARRGRRHGNRHAKNSQIGRGHRRQRQGAGRLGPRPITSAAWPRTSRTTWCRFTKPAISRISPASASAK